MKKILFNEDCFCQIEILARSNHKYVMQQLKNSQMHQNYRSQLLGFSTSVEREEPPKSTKECKISEEVLSVSLIGTSLIKTEVFSEYDDFTKPCENIFAFSSPHAENIVLFFEKEDTIVSNIWLVLDLKTNWDYQVAREMIVALSALGDFMIVDWGWDFVADLANQELIAKYLKERQNVFKDL